MNNKSKKKKVLFVCMANVIRSQMAEAFYNKLTRTKKGSSAGVLYSSPLKFNKPHKKAIEVMEEEGIDISDKKVKKVTLDMMDDADKIYVLTSKENAPYFLKESRKTEFWDIDDPLRGEIEDYRKVRDQIKKKVKSIIK